MRTIFFLMAMIMVTGCNLVNDTIALQAQSPTPNPLPNVRIVQATLPDTSPTPVLTAQPTRDVRPIPTLTPAPTALLAEALYTCGVEAPEFLSTHQAVANIDYASKLITVAHTIRYTHTEPTPLETLVLNVETNNAQGGFQIGQVRLGNVELSGTLDQNRLTVLLPVPLDAFCQVTLQLTYSLTPPRISSGIGAFKGYYGYSERQLNLCYWLVAMAIRRNGEWVVNPPQTIGEQIVLDQADWEVTLNVANANGDLRVAVPGVVTPQGNNQFHVRFRGGRDLPVSMSENYRLSTLSTPNGTQVELYSFSDAIRNTPNGTQDGAEHALKEAVLAVSHYEKRFGAYPFGRLLIAQGDFPDGMEFSGLVFVSTNWFYQWQGGVDNFLTVITVHEVSHQWWYTQVGNDAAYSPWLDEALATYSEYLYYEAFYPNLKNWWWSFRVGYYNPTGNVDSAVYEFTTIREYINAVYLRGVQMLHNVRTDIGDDSFFALLRQYATQGNGKVANSQFFWSLLPADQLALTEKTRQQFLARPDVLGNSEE